MSPFLKWGLADIVGGGVAGTVQGFTAITRIASTATTGGLGNSVVSTAEAGGSLVMSILALAVPVLAAILVLAILIVAFRKIYVWIFRRNKLEAEANNARLNP